MADRFPKDCWGKKCPHFKVWDVSVEDLHCECTLLNKRCKGCDEDLCFIDCPLISEPALENKDK